MSEAGAIAFGEKVLALLGQGRFTATYKYAVLLGLIDLCLEGVSRGGEAPGSVTTRQLAERVTELYWPQTVPFGGGAARVLRQVRSGQNDILKAIGLFRTSHAPDRSATLVRSRLAEPEAYRRLVGDVEWKLVEMPIPRLQKFGTKEDRFIYQYDWGDGVRRREFLDPAQFSNVLRFVGDAGHHLVRLAGLLRPLLQRRWAADVARMNVDLVQDAALEDFLFGASRVAPGPVLDGLRALQGGRCFYCGGALRQAEVDHFIPWARVPMNAIENLVVADRGCNGAKNDHLAAADHVERWAARAEGEREALEAIAREAAWEQGRERVLGIARASYLWLPPSARLWRAPAEFVAAEPERLARALASAG